MRFLFFYLMNDDKNAIRSTARDHAQYWHSLELPYYEGGPFEDRSGGLIVFESDSLVEARRYVSGDPFVEHDLLSATWLKQWSNQPLTIPS